MKKFVSKSFKLCLLFFSLLIILGYYLEYQFEKDNSNKFIWLRNKKNQNFDFAFIGSSRTLNMIDIIIADSLLCANGINLGIGGADFRTLYMVLYTFLEINNNEIEELFIQVDPFNLYSDRVYNKPRYDHYFFRFSEDENINRSLYSSNKIFIYKYLPVLKYIEYNNVYNLTHFIRSFKKESIWDITKGSSLIYNQLPFNTETFQSKSKSSNKFYTFDSEDEKYLIRIIDLCSRNSVNATLYGAPIYNYENNFKNKYPNFDTEIMSLTNRIGLDYLNFMEHEYESILFKDFTHLNYKGSAVFTKTLITSKYINSGSTH